MIVFSPGVLVTYQRYFVTGITLSISPSRNPHVTLLEQESAGEVSTLRTELARLKATHAEMTGAASIVQGEVRLFFLHCFFLYFKIVFTGYGR